MRVLCSFLLSFSLQFPILHFLFLTTDKHATEVENTGEAPSGGEFGSVDGDTNAKNTKEPNKLSKKLSKRHAIVQAKIGKMLG